MKTLIGLLYLISYLFIPQILFAETTVIITSIDNQSGYTVPPGKVLFIENIYGPLHGYPIKITGGNINTVLSAEFYACHAYCPNNQGD